MSGESGYYWERPGSQPHPEYPGVLTTPQQVLTGLRVGTPDLRVLCASCGTTLREGEACTVYAYRAADAREWDAARCYCRPCAPEAIATPTLGVTEALVHTWPGVVSTARDQTHRLCLAAVDLTAFSPPTEGSEP